MEESRLWHILIVISSLRTCIKFFDGEASDEDYLRMRMFPNNFEYIEVSQRIESLMSEARIWELPMNKQLAKGYYQELEKEFLVIFYEEIEKGIPQDVRTISKDDEYFGDLPKTLETLMV